MNDQKQNDAPVQNSPSMKRVVGIWGAVFLGLGSILGTGVFVSLGLGAGVVGSGVILAVVAAGVVAIFNGLSSAQLAASHPVSGGTYEYGYRYWNAPLGFSAGWMFLCAKSASAATAALGLSGYLLTACGLSDSDWRTPVAFGFVILWTWIVAAGIERSSRMNAWIVGFTLLGLLAFVVAGGVALAGETQSRLVNWIPEHLGLRQFLEAVALMFVAFTGYGRVATLGEEVTDPARTIPKAVILTLAVTVLLYVAVAWVAVSLMGGAGYAAATRASAAPLEVIAQTLSVPGLSTLVGMAAITAMAGVLLNLLLGLSRVLLAMGRRGDMPRFFGKVEEQSGSPVNAVYGIGALIAGLVLIGDVRATWSFSAFTVLVYYAITNLCALRLSAAERSFPRITAVLGLVSCAGLAFYVRPIYWMVGLAVLGAGLVAFFIKQSKMNPSSGSAGA